MIPERTVAGIKCSLVLQDLSNFLDGDLPPERVQQIQEHLKGCDWCESFGGAFGKVVQQLRQTLNEAEPLSNDIRSRLYESLQRDCS